jgi:hypothetical protein
LPSDVRSRLLLNLVVGPGIPAVSSEASATQTWYSVDGEVCAWANGGAAAFEMTWPGLGVFRIDREDVDIVASPIPGVAHEAVADIFARGVAPVALLHRGFEVLHASAVRLPQGLVGFCARSGTGKSTLAHALAARGHRQWADDTLALTITPAGAVASRLPFLPRVAPRQRLEYGVSRRDWPPARIEAVEEMPLKALFVLGRTSDPIEAAARIERVPPAEAITVVLPQAHDVDLGGPGRQRELITRYLDLVAAVPVFRVSFYPDLGRLSALAEAVERHSMS